MFCNPLAPTGPLDSSCNGVSDYGVSKSSTLTPVKTRFTRDHVSVPGSGARLVSLLLGSVYKFSLCPMTIFLSVRVLSQFQDFATYRQLDL